MGGTNNKYLINQQKKFGSISSTMGSQLLQIIFQSPWTWRQIGSQEIQKDHSE